MKDQYTCASCAKTVQGDKCPNCGIGKFTATVVPPTEDRDWRKHLLDVSFVGPSTDYDTEAVIAYVEELITTAEARGRKEMLEKITAVLRDLRRKLEGITGKTDLASGALMIVEEIEDALSSENK